MSEGGTCGGWERVARVDDVPPGRAVQVSVRGVDIALCNVDGELYAIGDTCTHAQASLTDGDYYEDIRGWVLECPLHGSQFDVTTGEAVSLPATGNSGKYGVKVEDGEVYVSVEPVVAREE